jgi:hypothetical protein
MEGSTGYTLKNLVNQNPYALHIHSPCPLHLPKFSQQLEKVLNISVPQTCKRPIFVLQKLFFFIGF